MEAKAVAKYVRVSPRKARVVIDQVRGKDVVRAREILRFSERAIAETIEKVLNSAVANAENNLELSKDNLYVAEVSELRCCKCCTERCWQPRQSGC